MHTFFYMYIFLNSAYHFFFYKIGLFFFFYEPFMFIFYFLGFCLFVLPNPSKMVIGEKSRRV